MTPLKFVFWLFMATFAMMSGLLWEAGIGREVPGVLLAEIEKVLVKSAEAKSSGKEDPHPITVARTETAALSKPETYTVKRGDWLSKIAEANGVTIEALVKANKDAHPSLRKNPSLIHPGWALVIPTETAAAIATATRTSSPEKSVAAQAEQNVYPETVAKAAPRDKRAALSKEGAPKRTAQKERRGTRHPETLRLKLTRELPNVDAIVTAYGPIVEKAAREYKVPKHFIYGLIYHESGGNTHAIGDGGRSRGLMQLHDPTRIRLGLTKKEAHDPEKAIPAGTRYLREQYDAFGRDPAAAISAYNAPWLTQKMLDRGTDPSNRTYVRSVGAAAKLFKEYEKLTSL